MTQPEPAKCYRCGEPGHVVDEFTIRNLGGDVLILKTEECLTDGCTDPDGSRRLHQLTPTDLRDKADAAWMARQRRLVEER